jgi:hypothetical protein
MEHQIIHTDLLPNFRGNLTGDNPGRTDHACGIEELLKRIE